MITRHLLLAATAALLLGGTDLRAEGLQGRWTIAARAGTTSEVTGDILSGSTGSLFEQPVTIEAKKYRRVYKPSLLTEAQIGYFVSQKSEILVRGSYYETKKVGVEAGTLGPDKVDVFLDRYVEWGVEAAWHRYLVTDRRLKSYVGPVAGARFLDSILATFSIPDARSVIQNVPLHKAGAVALFGVDIGFSFDLTRNVFVGVETGLRYQTKPPRPSATVPGLEMIGSGGDRWSAPVTAALGVRF
jgi:hypothetical protein